MNIAIRKKLFTYPPISCLAFLKYSLAPWGEIITTLKTIGIPTKNISKVDGLGV